MTKVNIPAISIVMPVYNSALYLKECMDSIISQSFKDFELIVLDDGSTDNSVEILQSYKDSRIQLVLCEHDFIRTLNRGINMAKGKYIARMDADDIMCTNRLEVEHDFMEKNPLIDVCGSSVQFFGERNQRPAIFTHHNDIASILIQYGCFFHPTIIMRRKKIAETYLSNEKQELYNPAYKYAEDYHLWTDMVIKGFKFANIPQVLLYQRLSEGQVTSIHKDEMNRLGEKIRIIMAEFIACTIINSNDKQLIIKYEQSFDMFTNNFISRSTFYKIISNLYRYYLNTTD